MRTIASFLLSAGLISLVVAECPNACSSHGRCSNFDMCLCYRNWMSNDCSERVCQFGLAHVDTPKGDLDSSSGVLSGPDDVVIQNNEVYPWGTTEQFPEMKNSNGTDLENSAHYYMECSNKGICDRESGLCECFPGYEGSACQRASCPSNEDGVCSGHGTCETIAMLTANDHGNMYELWDRDSTMGCDCDPGYYGPDCSQRRCKYGPDPLYDDDMMATRRVANWTFGFYIDKSSVVTDMFDLHGNYSIHFYDVFGEDWETMFIDANADCAEIIARLESLPNDVIPEDSVLCLKHSVEDADIDARFLNLTASNFNDKQILRLYTLVFTGNVGVLKQPMIDIYLDGARPTLVSNETDSTVVPFVFADGFHGEFEDLVPDMCEGVLVTIEIDGVTGVHYLGEIGVAEAKLLKRCLGDSNGDLVNDDANEVYDWDYGDAEFPHLIKLIDNSDYHYSRICNESDAYFPAMDRRGWCDNYNPAGFYAPLIYDSVADRFNIYTQAGLDYVKTAGRTSEARFYVYTTTGVLSQRGRGGPVDKFYFDTMFSNTLHTTEAVNSDSSLDCESGNDLGDFSDCIEKGDYVMLFHTSATGLTVENSFRYPNIYTVEKIGVGSDHDGDLRTTIVLNMGTNIPAMTNMWMYKFTPGKTDKWVNECSDRGVCDADTGLCKCFGGYTSDDCSKQNALAH